MFTEQILRQKPALIKIFLGLPAAMFWQLVEKAATCEAAYQQKRRQRPDRQRAVGGGRKPDLGLSIRLALVLSYLRLHLTQEAVAALYAGATQTDVSRQLRMLLPWLADLLPTPEIWDKIDEDHPLTPQDLLELTQLSDGRVIVDATEQQVYRSEVSEVRKAHYSGKKKQFTLKTQLVTDGNHHIVAMTITIPGATNDKKLADQVATLDRLPDDCHAAADKGYQGFQHQIETTRTVDPATGEILETPRLTFDTPTKKPKGAELTEAQEATNQALNAWRVRIEHCLGWAKNWKILATRFRAAHSLYSTVMQVVCGLVNWQTNRWQALKLLPALP
jgi:DDE superfamily endonuclease